MNITISLCFEMCMLAYILRHKKLNYNLYFQKKSRVMSKTGSRTKGSKQLLKYNCLKNSNVSQSQQFQLMPQRYKQQIKFGHAKMDIFPHRAMNLVQPSGEESDE